MRHPHTTDPSLTLGMTRDHGSLEIMSRVFVAIRGVIYAFAFVVLWTWLARSAQRLDPHLPFGFPLWLRPVGMVLAIAGAALAAFSIGIFIVRGRGTPAPFDAPRQFVATGPYRYVRNPMYLGALTLILGAGLALQSVSVALLALVFGALAHLFVLLYEEPTLQRLFGASYHEYRKVVNRWLPRPPRF